jgi:hypothetical protein
MSRLPLASILLALTAFASPASADPVFTASGSFLVGDPFSYSVFDSCGLEGPQGPQEGIDSSCIFLDDSHDGASYTVTSSDATGQADVAACFYAPGDFLSCPTDGIVPAGAVMVSFTSLVGVDVHWTFAIF